jgi:hypothetical protein
MLIHMGTILEPQEHCSMKKRNGAKGFERTVALLIIVPPRPQTEGTY